MKELTRRGALLGAAVLATSACTRRRSARTLRVAFSPPTLAAMYRAIAAEFERAHPGVAVELMPAVSYGDLMQRDFRLALIEDEPDVSHIGLNHVRFYAERGLAQPLEPLLGAAGDDSLSTHAAIGRVDGAVRALPFAVSVPVSFFNADLIRRYGCDPQAMLEADWSALLDMAAAVSRAGLPVSGIFFDYTPESALAWQMLILSRGGRMMSPDERHIAFDGPEGLWSARLLRALGAAGQLDLSRENARMAFAAGQLGCYQNTSANIRRFTDAATGFPVLVAPLPIAPGGHLPAAGNAAAIVTRDEARQPLAWDYVRFACGPVAQTIMARATGYLSLNRAALDDTRLLKPLLERQPFYRRLYQEADRLAAWYAFPGPRSEQIAELISDEMRLLILGRVPPETGLGRMAEKARELLDR